MSNQPLDHIARTRALDPSTSFIVQAPAGSGKTELLTRRVLTLLNTVERPEDVLAITFTRKAAAEMRHRVIETLKRASDPSPAESDYEEEGLALARAVLERDARLEWKLIDDPERLGMRTIDSLAVQLAHSLPVSSGLGAPIGLVDDASELYRLAAERFLASHVDKIGGVSQQLDNQLERLRDLLAELLGVRDQWRRYVGEDFSDTALRDVLESMLARLLQARMANARAAMPPGLVSSLTPILGNARKYLLEFDAIGEREIGDDQQKLLDLADALVAREGKALGTTVAELDEWRLLSGCLLTKDAKGFRKTVTVAQGFPAENAHKKLGVEKSELAEHKQSMMELLKGLAGDDALRDALAEVRDLPPPTYTDQEWALLGQLGIGLRLLLAELTVVFAERGQLDFVETAARAVEAMGEEDEPTDLALGMDLRIRHLLVDEFQDTSRAQFALFERLVAGWEPDDGRSFFAVGDPMQSIYRFREGDVGLFLRAVDEGIGSVALTPLQLEVNFRSAPGVVDWVNTHFAAAFPDTSDRDVGEVIYESSQAHRDTQGQVEVHVLNKASTDDPHRAEAEAVGDLVQQAIEQNEDGTVGVLLRSRTPVPHIVAALQSREIAFRAVDLERLGDRPVVRDLIALALALRYPHDRISWLSLLRSPICGLRLTDLHALVGDAGSTSVPELLQQAERVQRLSEDGQQRLSRFCREILPAVQQAPRSAVMPWVEAIWLRLGGPSVCRDAIDLDAAERVLVALAELEARHGLWQRADVRAAIARLFAGSNADESAARVQLMTIHKSKGLEFDTVILPALARAGGGGDRRLLDWYESTADNTRSLLLAPIDKPNIKDSERSAIGKLLRRARKAADAAERLRLFYVACTRAQTRLHLVATLGVNAKGETSAPSKETLLGPVWPTLAGDNVLPDVEGDNDADETADTEDSIPEHQPLTRNTLDWALPNFNIFSWQLAPPAKAETQPVEYDWQGSTARDVGTVVHRELQRLAELAMQEREVPDSAGISRIVRELRTLGVTEVDLDSATAQVVRALGNTLDDERGRWTLDEHAQGRSEWALSVPTVIDGRVSGVQRIIVDRTFVDDTGTRWVVDFKTSSHEGGGLNTFLDREVERYREQLEGYANVMQRVDPDHPVRVGLWFPMVRGWREYTPASA